MSLQAWMGLFVSLNFWKTVCEHVCKLIQGWLGRAGLAALEVKVFCKGTEQVVAMLVIPSLACYLTTTATKGDMLIQALWHIQVITSQVRPRTTACLCNMARCPLGTELIETSSRGEQLCIPLLSPSLPSNRLAKKSQASPPKKRRKLRVNKGFNQN
ncbi:hypothetical protein KIL84_002994 [Mauremys mutica]|uniref:Uncharacterized protein n=1 Tax=Mauremys mutica TaxID=74926 RepID=A0A9D3WT85_9SAUR|nr:hypothetical protein KIL84_002994 [Mauremys mutica]